MEAAAVGATAAEGVDGRKGEVEGRELPGPGLTSLALFALLHVSKNPREGIPVAIDVLQEIVRISSCGLVLLEGGFVH